jgi:hypothetical protein
MTSLVGIGAHLPTDRVGAAGRRRARCRPDEDAVTLAVQAAGAALSAGQEPRALIFAGTTPPYDEGGVVQPIAELLGLSTAVFACELTAGAVDGLAALRLADALAGAGNGPVLVCAAEVGRGGDAGVAVLVDDQPGLATLSPTGSSCEEIRDRWRLRGSEQSLESDRSFLETIGTVYPVEALGAGGAEGPRLIYGPHPKAAARLEQSAGGPGDSVAPAVGDLGAVHPLMRLLADGVGTYSVVAVAGGRAESVEVSWAEDAENAREEIRQLLAAGDGSAESVGRTQPLADFTPYASVPRSWRERGVDLRLEGILPPTAPVPGRQLPTGTVVTFTEDHVYPGGSPTGMAAVDLEGGGRFFGQVVAGDKVAVADPVRLVPRRLHDGGGVVQYFWKVEPCR